jgi:ATP/maltotriose-dependent transcriptional regulator MalT
MTRTADDVGVLPYRDDRMNAATRQRPVEGWQSLTAAEWAVVDLVTRGLKNRDVAAELLLSRHTVDFHLRQIYRKLNIASRGDAGQVLDGATDNRLAG